MGFARRAALCATVTGASLVWVGVATAKDQHELYVAVGGSDAQPGTKDKPFASLEAARDAVRGLKTAGPLRAPVTVWIRGGTYRRTKTFRLEKQDSGTEDAPIVYRAYGTERVSLTGGQALEPAWFEPVKDQAAVRRLQDGVRARVMQVDLKAHGIRDYGELGGLAGGMRPFHRAARLPLSRWPNEGDALAKRGKVEGTDANGFPNVVDEGRQCKTVGFRFTGKPPAHWHDLETVWLWGFWWQEYCIHSWHPRYVNLDRQEIGFGHALPEHVTEWRRFRAYDALEEIDQPGEWHLDRKKGVLYLWPPDDFDKDPIEVSMLRDDMIALGETSYVTIRGLTLEVMRGTAITVGGGSHNLIAGCTIRNANHGVSLAGGLHNGVVGCDIHDLYAAGVQVSGGDRATLTPGGHYVVNNHIHHYAQLYKTWKPGVRVNGVGHRVAHNRIHHAPQYAISYDGNDHVFEYNDMHDLCLEMSDVGVIGCGTDWTYRGNVIRHNFIHHIPKRPYPGVCGVYLDNCACSADVVGNVFYKMVKPVMIGGGRDTRVVNNVFVECEVPVYMDNRGLRWRTRWGHFKPGGPMYAKLLKFKPHQPPWSTRYPKLARILDEFPQAPLGHVLARNVSVRSGWRDPEAECRRTFKEHIDRRYMTIADNYVTNEDPGFVDAEGADFALRDDSIIYVRIPGFRKIPFDEIGLYYDKYRASWPVPRRG